MNLCIVRHGYFPDDPRDRKQAFALVEAGHFVDIICLRKKGQTTYKKTKGTRVFRIPLTHKRSGVFRYFTEYTLSFVMISIVLSYQFVKKRYDCIQVSTMPDFLVFTTIIPKLLGGRVLMDLHEPTPELWITKYGRNHLSFLLHLQTKIEQLAIGYADRCLTVTEALRRRFGERGANLEKITVIPNVCEEAFCNSSSTKIRIFNGKFRLVTHGLIEERYGHEVAIRAVNSLHKKIPGLQFEILGDGEYKKTAEAVSRKLRCEDRVHFLGYVPFYKLLKILSEADVGIIAMNRSPYSELVDTNKMYEYIALRKPIIISRLRVVEENFDESCMMFFEPGNVEDLSKCIVELYRDQQKRRTLAENAYRRYEKMRWRKTKRRYLRVIENLAAEKTK